MKNSIFFQFFLLKNLLLRGYEWSLEIKSIEKNQFLYAFKGKGSWRRHTRELRHWSIRSPEKPPIGRKVQRVITTVENYDNAVNYVHISLVP